MTQSIPPSRTATPHVAQRPDNVSSKDQQGVVLIIALILLVVISLLAVTSLRNAGSTESVAGNVRTTELAIQAAEIALRHCESSALKITMTNNPANTDTVSAQVTYATAITEANILRATDSVQWKRVTNTWDIAAASVNVLPAVLVGNTATYKRRPECMIESLSGSTTTPTGGTDSFVITARGFGPEVAAGTGRPQGSEVWLQSTIEIN